MNFAESKNCQENFKEVQEVKNDLSKMIQIVLLLSCVLCFSVSTICRVVDSQFDWQTVLSFDVAVDFHYVVTLS